MFIWRETPYENLVKAVVGILTHYRGWSWDGKTLLNSVVIHHAERTLRFRVDSDTQGEYIISTFPCVVEQNNRFPRANRV